MLHTIVQIVGAGIAAVAVLLCMAVLVLLSYAAAYRWWERITEYRLRRRIGVQGRLVQWPSLVARFAEGRGTLIVQYVTPESLYFGGQIREWWTEDDIIEESPVRLPASLAEAIARSEEGPYVVYALACVNEYTDVDSSSAFLTDGPRPVGYQIDTTSVTVTAAERDRGLVVTGRKLHEKYPKGRIVTLVNWDAKWLLLLGDADETLTSGL